MVDFFEVISENFMVNGGAPRYHLEQILETYRVIQHGVSLSIGGPDPIDRDYLQKLKRLVRQVQPPWLSDHCCWCGAGGAHLHDLLPLPYCREAVERLVERAAMVQDFLEVRFALENTSSYLAYTHSSMTEWQFLSEVAERADIGLLLDVNNVYVSAYNHAFGPLDFIRGLPHDRIVQLHLAGHTNLGTHIIDTHRGPVIDAVWDLYQELIRLAGPITTLIEWDDEIPEFATVLAEAERAKRLAEHALDALVSANASRVGPNQSDSRIVERLASSQDATDSAPFAWKQGGPREHGS
jgi:uncharacterized protein (UPF0276 family)